MVEVIQSSLPRKGHPRREAGSQSHGTPPEFAGLPGGTLPTGPLTSLAP
jgi:hypothetical protein